MDEWLPFVAAIVTALLANGAGLWLVRSEKNKLGAESASILTGAALEFVTELRTEIEKLEAKVETLQADLERTRRRAKEREAKLLARISALEKENEKLRALMDGYREFT